MIHYTDIALKYIKYKKNRSILTILGVSVSVMMLYLILNLSWSCLLNYRSDIRNTQDYEIVLLTESTEQIEKILSDSNVKDGTVAEYYFYDYNEPVVYENALYINTINPYRMNRIYKELTDRYGIDGILNNNLANTYMQGSDYEAIYIAILIVLLIAYLFSIFGVGTIRNSIQLTMFEQVKDYGNIRCIGATMSQLGIVIYMQGLIIEIAGIVFGIVLGTFTSMLAGMLTGWEHTGFHMFPVVFVLIAYLVDLYFAMKENVKLVNGMSPISAIRGEYRIKQKRVKRCGHIAARLWMRLFGMEGEYAYKNLMRSPGRFYRTVAAMTLGIAAAFIICSGVRLVLDYDRQWKDMYGYFNVYAGSPSDAFESKEELITSVPPYELYEQVSALPNVEEAKQILSENVFSADGDRDIVSHYTEEYIGIFSQENNENMAVYTGEIEEDNIFDADDRSMLLSRNALNIVGYDEEDLERCREDLIDGTLEVSEHGLIVAEDAYVDVYDKLLRQWNRRYIHVADYEVGDTIEIVNMKELRKRYYYRIEDRKKQYEKESERYRSLMNEAQENGDSVAYERLYNEWRRNVYDSYYFDYIIDAKADVYEELVAEGNIEVYTIEGVLKKNPNGCLFGEAPTFILPKDQYFEITGRDSDWFSGMMYHFTPFSIELWERVDWYGLMGGESNYLGWTAELNYQVSEYVQWEYEKRDYRNVILGAGLIVFFLVSMTIVNFINAVSSSIYMRRREFAQLRVIGVSKKGLFKMVMLEGVIASLLSCIFGAILGGGLSYALVTYVLTFFKDVEFVFPWIPAIVSVVISILILCGAVYFPLRKMPNDVAAELATSGE
ncbi:MAG: ABC transporter permease [Lachnospiraceae bacterium]|nr:ABC transporter permease [Lachnospiraceae bacterium]